MQAKKKLFLKRGNDFVTLPDKRWFTATLEDISAMETDFGEALSWKFKILGKTEYAGQLVRAMTGLSINPEAPNKSRLLNWIEILEDVEDFEELDCEPEQYNVAELIGKKCAIFVEQKAGTNKKDGSERIYNNVTKVKSFDDYVAMLKRKKAKATTSTDTEE